MNVLAGGCLESKGKCQPNSCLHHMLSNRGGILSVICSQYDFLALLLTVCYKEGFARKVCANRNSNKKVLTAWLKNVQFHVVFGLKTLQCVVHQQMQFKHLNCN